MDTQPDGLTDLQQQHECRLLSQRGYNPEQIAKKLNLAVAEVNRHISNGNNVNENLVSVVLPKVYGANIDNLDFKRIFESVRSKYPVDGSKKYSFILSASGSVVTNLTDPSGDVIDSIDYSVAKSLTLKERLELIEQNYKPLGSNLPISEALALLFPSLLESLEEKYSTDRPIPIDAPVIWNEAEAKSLGRPGRIENESPPNFIKRVYGDWIGKGLTRPAIRQLDPKLYQALATWTRRHGELDFELPSKSDDVNRWADAVSTETASAEMRELARRSAILRRRLQK